MKARVAFTIFSFCLGTVSRLLAPLMAFAEPEVVSSVSRTLVAAPWAATMPIGDLNQDGVSELLGYRALGFSEVQFSGEAKIFSGVSGQVLDTVRGEAADDQFFEAPFWDTHHLGQKSGPKVLRMPLTNRNCFRYGWEGMPGD